MKNVNKIKIPPESFVVLAVRQSESKDFVLSVVYIVGPRYNKKEPDWEQLYA